MLGATLPGLPKDVQGTKGGPRLASSAIASIAKAPKALAAAVGVGPSDPHLTCSLSKKKARQASNALVLHLVLHQSGTFEGETDANTIRRQ